jgi:protein-tyrosine phosphatase
VTPTQWIALEGAANVRDLGGLPTGDGQVTQSRRLIRSDNLQGLTPADVKILIDDLGVRSIADLRTGIEVAREGPGPMTRESSVQIKHLSLFPEAGHNTDVAALDDDAPVVLPWQTRGSDLGSDERRGASGVYLRYLDDRADSVLAALRLIAHSDGATLVHCAAGKDRTGVVIGLALAEGGVTPAAIIDDYAASAQRIEEIFTRLRSSRTYVDDLTDQDVDKHTPRAATMQRMLEALGTEYGGADGWLRRHGWTDVDATALRAKLLRPSS